jgi:hypothetical protein
LPRQGAHEIDNVAVSRPSRLASAVFLRCQTGMVAALPVDDHLQVVTDDVDDNL